MSRFWVSEDSGASWRRVGADEFRRVERAAGFLPTGGFSNGLRLGRMSPPTSGVVRQEGETVAAAYARVFAAKIREDLVCCEIHERLRAALLEGGWGKPNDAYRELRASDQYHGVCDVGEWAARIVEETGASWTT